MYIGDWNINFDDSGYVIACTKKSREWTIAVRRNYVFLIKRLKTEVQLRSDNNNLASDFAKHLSGEHSATQKIEKQLTMLKKIGRLYGIESVI